MKIHKVMAILSKMWDQHKRKLNKILSAKIILLRSVKSVSRLDKIKNEECRKKKLNQYQ